MKAISKWLVAPALAMMLISAITVTQQAQAATTFTVLHSFDTRDGESPLAGLIQATNGDLYGTTSGGGTNGWGTVFKITPGGALTTLYNFCSQINCTDGSFGYAGLIQATDGDFYGTMRQGGDMNVGTVFKILPDGTFTTLYSFCSQANCTDGAYPYAGLIQATDGDLYGTAESGGANGDGIVFKITPGGTLTTIHSFCSVIDCADGANPFAGLVQATNGNFYGTTAGGGSNGHGTVFTITPDDMLTTLYSFCAQTNCTDGALPQAGLIQATKGELYGTLSEGGASNYGMVFWITPGGLIDTYYSFCSHRNSEGHCTDGAYPDASMIQATDGNFYGTTYSGGAKDEGTVFKITPGGTLTTLYSFCAQTNCTDGSNPRAALIQDTNGDLYGTTESGGANDYGTVFRLSVGLGPFVETQTTSGKVGATVKILGTDLTGASSVKFNGTKAVFTLKSKSEIDATVPTGATSGPVQVVTPGGALNSNVNYRVES